MEITTESMFSIRDRVVAVTGGYGGVGGELCEILSRLGAKVAVMGRNGEKCRALAEAIYEKTHTPIKGYEVDVTDEASLENAFAQVYADFGSVWGLVNSAGVTHVEFIRNMSVESWQKVIDVNLKGTFLSNKIAGKYMEKNRAGRIINISSPAAVMGKPGYSAYTPSKAGVDGLTKTLAIEWGRKNITVNAIWPIFVMSVMTRQQWGEEADDRANEMAACNPQGRNCSAELMSGLITFLLSDSSSYVNGQIIACDGGWSSGLFTEALPQDKYDD